jgi:hypothetical protein
MVDLPVPIGEIINVDAVTVTHTHLDHWDGPAKDALPKAIPLFVQNEQDATAIQAAGFADVRVLSAETNCDGISLTIPLASMAAARPWRKSATGWGRCAGSSSGIPTRRPSISQATPFETGISRKALRSTRPISSS